jgi:hypothetical protein
MTNHIGADFRRVVAAARIELAFKVVGAERKALGLGVTEQQKAAHEPIFPRLVGPIAVV